jgi:lipid-A-disaccharide synthase
MPPTIFISAGEASGEHYGALLVEALKQRLVASSRMAAFFGMGGQRMEAAGLERIVRSEEMAVMGLTEVIRHLPRIWREFRKLKKAIRARRPSVAVLIDFPEVHFRLARELHGLGIPVVYFVSPQLWAWKKHRIKLVQKYIDKMLVIFPFEEPFYRENGVEAEFVGHPLADLPAPTVSREQFAAENKLDPSKTWIGLLPGSRPREIHDNLAEMLRAAGELAARSRGWDAEEPIPVKGTGFSPYIDPAASTRALAPEGIPPKKGRLADETPEKQPSGAKAPAHFEPFMYGLKPVPSTAGGLEFIVPLAPTLNAAQLAEVLSLVEDHGGGLAIRLVHDARAALFHARASVVASGTATVEAALIGNPFVVVYRVSPLTYAIAKRLVKVPHVAMANLIAGKRVVPELIQSDFTAANIVQRIEQLLPDGAPRESMMEELSRVRGLLDTRPAGDTEAGGAIGRVAAIVLDLLGTASSGAARKPAQP